MKVARLLHIRVSAPAVVMLATVVNVAAAEPAREAQFAATPELSWVVRGGVTHSAQSTRVLLAKKAVKAIHSADRLSGARNTAPAPTPGAVVLPDAPALVCASLQPARGSQQHSAP